MENPPLTPDPADALARALLRTAGPERMSDHAYDRLLAAVQARAAQRHVRQPVIVKPLLTGWAWAGVGLIAAGLLLLGFIYPSAPLHFSFHLNLQMMRPTLLPITAVAAAMTVLLGIDHYLNKHPTSNI